MKVQMISQTPRLTSPSCRQDLYIFPDQWKTYKFTMNWMNRATLHLKILDTAEMMYLKEKLSENLNTIQV